MVEEAIRRKSWWRRIPLRLSLRALIVPVLVIGGGLGWIAYRARVQRQAVAAIETAGGRVGYDWIFSGHYLSGGTARPEWKGLADTLGVDYVGNVTRVYFDLALSATRTGIIDDRLMAEIGRLDHVEHLMLIDRKSRLTDAGLDQIRNLTRLKKLDLYLGNSGRFDLAPLADLASLEELQLVGLPIDDDDLAQLAGLAQLRRLYVGMPSPAGGLITDAGLEHLARMTEMRDLELNARSLTTAGLDRLRGLTKLERLGLNHTLVDDLEPLGHMTRLESLDLRSTPMTDAGLAPISKLASLKRLDLSGTRVTDAGLASISRLASLKHLGLNTTKVTDVGMARLVGLKQLEQLWLHKTNIGDSGALMLAACPRLVDLGLSDTRLTDASLVTLSGITSLTSLRVARTAVTPAGVVGAARPGLRILR